MSLPTKLESKQLTVDDYFDTGKYWYHIRVTPHDWKLTLDEMANRLESDVYIVSHEIEAGKPHYHCTVAFDSYFTKEEIAAYRKRILEGTDFKGNKYIYCKKVKDLKQAFKYTLKEGNFKYKGIPDAIIERMFALSKKKIDYKYELKKLMRRYEETLLGLPVDGGELDFDEYAVEFIKLYASTHHTVSDNVIKSHLRAIWLINHGNVDRYARDMIDSMTRG